MGRSWQLPSPIGSLRRTTSTIYRSGASSVSITTAPACSHTRNCQPMKSHRAAVCPHVLESRCLPSDFSIRHGHPLKRQRGWNSFSQDAVSASVMPIHGVHGGLRQQRYLSCAASLRQQQSQEQHMPLTFVDLFAGIGVTHSVLKKNGLKCVYANEPDQRSQLTFGRNHTLDSPDLYLDSRDIRQVPLHDIPSHTLLAAWLPIECLRTKYETCRSLFARILQIAEAKRPPVVMVSGAQPKSPGPGNNAKSMSVRPLIYERTVELTQKLEAIGYRSTFAFYNNADFDLPVVRHNIFIVGVRADQNALPFKFKRPPRRSPGLALDRLLLSLEAAEQDTGRPESHLLDGVSVLMEPQLGYKTGELTWTNTDVLPPEPGETSFVRIGRWDLSERGANSFRIYHHLGFAMAVDKWTAEKSLYFMPGPGGTPILRRLTARELARLQGLPDDFLLPRGLRPGSQQISECAPPPMLDWVVKEMKRQLPHILASDGKRPSSGLTRPRVGTQTPSQDSASECIGGEKHQPNKTGLPSTSGIDVKAPLTLRIPFYEMGRKSWNSL